MLQELQRRKEDVDQHLSTCQAQHRVRKDGVAMVTGSARSSGWLVMVGWLVAWLLVMVGCLVANSDGAAGGRSSRIGGLSGANIGNVCSLDWWIG